MQENEIPIFLLTWHVVSFSILPGTKLYVHEKLVLSNISVRDVLYGGGGEYRFWQGKPRNVSTKTLPTMYNVTPKVDVQDSNSEWFLDTSLSGMWIIAYSGMVPANIFFSLISLFVYFIETKLIFILFNFYPFSCILNLFTRF